jgi:hypothetical protein
MTGTFHEDLYTFFIISRSVLLRIRKGFKFVRKLKYTFYAQYMFSENRAVYEIMWKNFAEPGRPQITIWRMLITC